MRSLLLLLFVSLSVTSSVGQCESGKCQDESKITRIRRNIVELYTHQANGDVTGFLSKLAPDFKSVFNGVEEVNDWKNKEFVERRFAAVTSGEVKFLQPITKLDENTVITTIQWSLRIKSTFEDFQFYAWNIKFSFNAEGLIQKTDIIGDSATSRYLEMALAPTTYDKKAIIMGFLGTFETRDVAGTRRFLSEQLIVKRNGQSDVVQWQDQSFLNILHKRALSVEAKPTLYVDAGHRAAQVHITWTFKMVNNPADPIVFRDAWYVVFPPADQPSVIAVIHSVVDTPSLMAVYEPMNDDIQALQRQFQEEQQQQQQQQQPPQ